MRAISSFSFEAGISTRECLAAIALRIRVNISAMGSVMYISKSGVGCRVSGDGLGPAFKPVPDTWPLGTLLFLPARLYDARNLSLERQVAETDTAQVELAQIRARPAATFAARITAHFELRFPCRLCN